MAGKIRYPVRSALKCHSKIRTARPHETVIHVCTESGLVIGDSTDVTVRWRWFLVWRRRFSPNLERINVGMARARNQRHHHYRER